ncbi:uncharacterized protein LOC123504604 isoform X2 [Portunus trituberculatus]|uniref:uncharacterized protein LOC123504604 isoform X2 n=1 Tax=Portunus trituberculatus TaxID=210409 RepID=UPI001E1CD9CC|nr:uncharacterized protein LOC123504604 isoform X2 [Portunus trituberculatus]
MASRPFPALFCRLLQVSLLLLLLLLCLLHFTSTSSVHRREDNAPRKDGRKRMKDKGTDGDDMKDKDMNGKDEMEMWKGRIPIRPLLKPFSSYRSDTAASLTSPVMDVQREEGMEIKEAETLEKEEEKEKLMEKEQNDDCNDGEMKGKGEEESHGELQDVPIAMKIGSEEMEQVVKGKYRQESEENEVKLNVGLTTKMDMDHKEEDEEEKEMEEMNGRSSSSPFHLPTILNVVHDFRYPTVQRGEEAGEETVLLQDGQPMDTRPLYLRAESSSGGGNVGVDECGRVFTELSGLITSPNFPFNYPNNAQCAYYISLPSEYTIALDCNDFSIQPGDRNCENDYLLITEDGQLDGEGVTRYCGDKALSLFTSTSNMTLLFVADSSYRYRGFTCRYRAINPDGTGAAPAVITNTTEEHHTVLCTGPGNDGWSGKCGVAGEPGATRVVGGKVVAKHQFPWMVAVLKVCGREEQHYCNICGGTVISRRWVLTGAHCVVSIPVEKLGLLLGDHNLYTLTPSQKFFLVAAVYIHPDFNMPSPLNNDLALAFLPQEMAFNSYVAPICLPPRNYDTLSQLLPDAAPQEASTTTTTATPTTAAPSRRNAVEVPSRQEGTPPPSEIMHEVLTGRNVSIYGWGIIDDDETPAQQLRGVSVEVLDNSVCRYYYGDLVTDLMMCTSGEGGTGPCRGDSGSPVQIQMENGRWVQLGILAFGAAYGCEAGYPSGNILLPPYISWIEGVTDLEFGTDY